MENASSYQVSCRRKPMTTSYWKQIRLKMLSAVTFTADIYICIFQLILSILSFYSNSMRPTSMNLGVLRAKERTVTGTMYTISLLELLIV